MKPSSFRYHAARTVEEAVSLLAEFAPAGGCILAGGQSLVPTMAFRLAAPSDIIDINGIKELGVLSVEDQTLCIGACVRHAAFHQPVAQAGILGELMSIMVKDIAHYPIRQRGTFCGALAQSDPVSEWCLLSVTLGATLVAQSQRGLRDIAAEDFCDGVMSNVLEEDEILTQARIPLLSSDSRYGFCEFSRRSGDFGIAMILVTYRVQDGVIHDPRVGVGGAESHPRRLGDAEAALTNRKPDAETFKAAASAAAAAVSPMTDHNTTAQYRRDLVETLTVRALESSCT